MIYRSPYLHIGVWLAIFLIYLGVYSRFLPFDQTLMRGIVHLSLLSGLFYFHWWLLRHWQHPERSIRYWLIAIVTFAFITLLRTYLNRHLPGESDLPFVRFAGQIPWFWASLASSFGVLALSYLFHLNERRIEAERSHLLQAEQRRTAELLQLRSHINPHFLFNVLNNIYSLATTRSEKTATVVLQLSQLLRYTTYHAQQGLVPLKLEIEQLQRYIKLFQLRSPEAFDIRLEISGEAAGRSIEPMLLIPLVENAFKHGDFIRNPEAFAHFLLEVTPDFLHFRGSNSFDDSDQQKDEPGGVGLDNIQQRLQLTYGADNSSLEWNTDQSTIFNINLKINSSL